MVDIDRTTKINTEIAKRSDANNEMDIKIH